MRGWALRQLAKKAAGLLNAVVFYAIRARLNVPPVGDDNETDRCVNELLEERIRQIIDRDESYETDEPKGLETEAAQSFAEIQRGLVALAGRDLSLSAQCTVLANVGRAYRTLRRVAKRAALAEMQRIVPDIETTTLGDWLGGNTAVQAVATAVATSGALVGIGWLYTWSYHNNDGVMDFFTVTDYITGGLESAMRSGWGLWVYISGEVSEYIFAYTSPERRRHKTPSRRTVLWDTFGTVAGHWFSMMRWFTSKGLPTRAFAWSVLPGVFIAVVLVFEKQTIDRISQNPKALLVMSGLAGILTAGACGLGWGDAILDCETPRAFEIRTSSRAITDATHQLQRGTPTFFVLTERANGRSILVPKNDVLWFSIAGTRTTLEADGLIASWDGPRECPVEPNARRDEEL